MSRARPPRYVPVNELPNHPIGQRFSWQLDLAPYTGVGQYEVDTRTLTRFMNLGSLWNVELRAGAFRKPKDDPGVSVGRDGSAVASRRIDLSRRPKGPQTHSNVLSPTGGNSAFPFWQDATLNLNVGGLADHLDSKQKLLNPEAWAASLDYLAMRALRRAVVSNNSGRDTVRQTMQTITLVGGPPLAGAMQGGEIDPAFLAITFGFMVGILGAVRTSVQYAQGRSCGLATEKIPFSVLPFAADRLAAIGAASLRHRHLIRYNKQ